MMFLVKKYYTRLSALLALLFALTMPFQFAKHFWPEFTYLQGVRIDYLAPFISVFDVVCIVIIIQFVIFDSEKRAANVGGEILAKNIQTPNDSYYYLGLYNS
ncbi:MAG: hypothetical protein U0525_04625 [Patescibacteria group bacterium]